jgi:hypothetical protein
MWTGVTLIIILAFNYSIFGFPLYRIRSSLNDKSTVMLMKQIKSGSLLKGAEEDYILDIFRREKAAIDRKLLILNAAAATLLILITSWMVFGLLFSKRK